MKADDRRGRSIVWDEVPSGQGALDPAIWIKWSESAMTEGMKWFNVWMQGTQRFWGAGFRAFGAPAPVAKDGLRRASDLPWMPHVEAQVIPLRRKTDRPGAEATKYSMRVPIPWPITGAKIISLEAIVGQGEPHRAETEADQGTARANENRETQA